MRTIDKAAVDKAAVDKDAAQRAEVARTLPESDWQPALSIVIPAYNEGPVIGTLLDELLTLCAMHEWQVLVIDDGSTDDTATHVRQRAEGRYLTLIRHPYNRGYGAAIKTGIRQALAPLVATMDADGQHDPHELRKLFAVANEYNLVVGQRTKLVHSPLWRMPGKWLLNRMANYLTGRAIPDLNSGMRLFHMAIIEKYLHLCPNGFSFSTTSTLVLINQGYTIHYVPITIRARHEAVQSTVTVRTGLDTLILIVRLASLFQPLRIFLPASGLFIFLGLLWGLPYIVLLRGVSVGALLMILTGLLPLLLWLAYRSNCAIAAGEV